MKNYAGARSWLVLLTLAAACADPVGTVPWKAGSLVANDEVSAAQPWITLTPAAVAREFPAAATVGEQVYVMGGWTGSTTSAWLKPATTGFVARGYFAGAVAAGAAYDSDGRLTNPASTPTNAL